MIASHPGGLALTRRLLALGEETLPGSVLDLGAGGGETVRYLRKLGYEAEGIDLLYPKEGPGTEASGKKADPWLFFGDMRRLPFAEQSRALCLAECSISVCGGGPEAFWEAYRVLKPGGSLLLSDVFFQKESAPSLSMPGPLTLSCWEKVWSTAGFRAVRLVDETPLWREFYLESLWNDNADPDFLEFFRKAGQAGCGYFLAWLRKGGNHGII